MIYTTLKKLGLAAFRSAGLEISLRRKIPNQTWLGLKAKPIRTIIDVGANTGQFARKCAAQFPEARIFCYEPLPGPYQKLVEWADRQQGQVSTFPCALGDRDGDIEMNLHEDHTPSSSLLATTAVTARYYPFVEKQRRIAVKQMRLDAALGDRRGDLISEILIKLDVQGYENRVIAGGTEIFGLASACLVEVNLDLLYESQAEFSEIVSLLRDLGYMYSGNIEQYCGNDGHCIFLEAVFSKNARGE